MSQILNTTVGYLLGELDEGDTFKDPVMLRRLKKINSLPEKVREHILYNLDAALRDFRTSQAYSG